MKKLTLSELFKGYNAINIPKELDSNSLFEISISQSDVNESSLLFITEKVGKEDKQFDTSILKNVPAALVVSKSHTTTAKICPEIRVGNVREALAYAYYNTYKIDYDKVKIIGVTGTNGKTTTATLIYRILQSCGYKTGFIGTGKIISDKTILSDDTYSMTTPDPNVLYPTITQMYNDGCEYIVMEVSSHSIALGKIAPLKFEYAIFTNLDNDHLDFHHSKEEYFNTKLKLFESSKRGLFNMDDEYSRKASSLVRCDKSTFGIIHQADAYATEIESSFFGSSFYYRQKDLIFRAQTRLLGAFNIYNTMAALRCVIDLGIKPCIAKKALQKIDNVDGRMEVITGDITFVIDYAHTPSAFYNSLKTLKQNLNKRQKLIVVFGCGGNRDVFKRPVFGRYAEELADIIIITEDNSRNEDFNSIANDITFGMSKNKYEVIKDREEAIRRAFQSALPGDIIALIGKGHEKYKIIDNKYMPFSERRIIDQILAEADKEYANKT